MESTFTSSVSQGEDCVLVSIDEEHKRKKCRNCRNSNEVYKMEESGVDVLNASTDTFCWS